MRKIALVFLLVISLCGCQKVEDVTMAIDEVIAEVGKADLFIRRDHTKTYYRYFLPSGVGNIASADTYNILEYLGHKVLLNLDIAKIIIDEYYEGEKSEDVYAYGKEVYKRQDLVKEIPYSLAVYTIDDYYLLNLGINDVTLTTMVTSNYIDSVLYEMFVIGLSVEVDKERVISDFSSLDVIDYRQESIDLFEVIVPQDGRLEELIKPQS